MSWEDKFTSWSQPPSKTEREKMENAETAIKKAIAADETLVGMDILVFPQGSYKARTNISQDSDVDICIRLNSTFFPRYPEGKGDADYGNIPGSITFKAYKNLIQKALEGYFGVKQVRRGGKAFDIHSNSYRVDADAVPTFARKYYRGEGKENYIKPVGTAFNSDEDKRINNWPAQNYDNGVTKQEATGKRFKKIVRILKNLRNEMQEAKIEASKDVASFLIESIVWNAPDTFFNNDTLYKDVRTVVGWAFVSTRSDEECKNFREVNNIKKLFHSTQPWSRESVNAFFFAAWLYADFDK